MEPVEVIRNYHGSDSLMTQTARVIYNLFVNDLMKFTDFDSTLGTAFGAAFLVDVQNAETVVADSTVIDQQVTLTENVLASMELARTKYIEVKYFVQKAFPKSAGTQGEFGLNDYEKARKSNVLMGQFLFGMHVACAKYNTQLIAVGYTQAKIDAILLIRADLLDNNNLQKVFQKQRPKLTEDRIIVLKSCYSTMMEVMGAAQIVYADDYAKQHQFVYHPSSGNGNEEFPGTIRADTEGLVTTLDVYSPETELKFKNTGVASLTFSLSKTNAMEGNLVDLDGGATIIRTLAELQVDATNIIVKNNDTTQAGSYLVDVIF